MNPTLLLFFSFTLGLIVGSFLNVITLRLPKDESIGGRSHCTNCGHTLTAKDLVPALSFLFLGGKCRYCKKKINRRYLLFELTTGLLFALVFSLSQPVNFFDYALLLRNLIGVSVLLVTFVTDFEHYLIFDKVIFSGLGGVTLFNIFLDIIHHPSVWYRGFFVSGLIGAATFGGLLYVMWRASQGRWLGFGDVKYMLLIGSLLGSLGSVVGFFLSFIIGAIVAIPLLILDKAGLKSKLPLGCFFSISAFLTLFW